MLIYAIGYYMFLLICTSLIVERAILFMLITIEYVTVPING